MRQSGSKRRSIVESVLSLAFTLFETFPRELLTRLEGVDLAPVFEDLLVVGGESYRFDGFEAQRRCSQRPFGFQLQDDVGSPSYVKCCSPDMIAKHPFYWSSRLFLWFVLSDVSSGKVAFI